MGTVHNLVDYFAVSGLNVTSGLEPDQLAGDNLHCQPLDRPYKSKVLAHFPDAVPGNPFDEGAVCMLCFPKGVRFRTGREKRETSFHTFIVTREDATRCHGAVLTFYEECDNRQIANAMQTLQDMHMAELSNAQSRTLYSHLQGSVYKRSPKLHRRPDPKTMDRVYNMREDKLFVTKTVAVLSQLPLVCTFQTILRTLQESVTRSGENDLPLEAFVYNLIHMVALPSPGRSLALTVSHKSVVCQRPGVHELPLLDYALQELFTLLKTDDILNVFSSILLEHQVLLHSTDFQRLMLVAEGLTALMFPFQWQHVYVPILPASLSHFLDAPVPFIMGLHHTTDAEGLQKLCDKVNICIVAIDEGTVILPEDLPAFPYRGELKSDIEQELRRVARVTISSNGNQRDSGYVRESFVGPDDSGMSSAEGSTSGSMWSIPNRLELLQQNEAVAKMTALAKKSGVISSLDDISASLDADLHKAKGYTPPVLDPHTRHLIVNSALREIFLHYFLQVFCAYESFVIQPVMDDMEQWLTNRESVQNFDKAAFLSDHPEAHLPFLSAFLETQMFTSFIDNKIIAQWEEPDPNLRIFEARMKGYRNDLGDQRIRRFYRSGAAKEAETVIERRALQVDVKAPPPQPLEGVPSSVNTKRSRAGVFPTLNHKVLSKAPAIVASNGKKKEGSRWRKKDRQPPLSEQNADQREKYIQEARTKVHQPKLSDMNPASMAQTNWKFVETLLKECKAKTKRMLVEKMGQEAVELGHGEAIITGVEENTLIASLCDLLERIWSHGLQQKQGRSALWSHLMSYQQVERAREGDKPVDPNLLTPDLSTAPPDGDQPCPSGTQTWPIRRHRRKPSRGLETPVLNQLPVSAIFDMRNVHQMSDIKTDVGFARAFVRLSLEKKLLSKHLKQLLSNADILRSLYKRYAFLRCEDEREQFLYHLLSLNAVDFFCFTNTFTNTVIPYRILIFLRQKLSGSSTTANCYLSLAGSIGETSKLPVPKHTLEMNIDHRNLGVLTTMRIGHDNAGMSPKWMVEHVLVRNEITGHTYRFPCGRWLGKGVDDGALERLLVAELVPPTTDAAELMEKCRTPPRCRSPSMPRKSNEPQLQISAIQEMLGDAVNNLVKHFYKPEKERGSLTGLLCGEYGLVFCMEHVFQCGFKSSRFLRDRLFIWDFLEKVQTYFGDMLADHEHYEISPDVRRTMQSYCYVLSRINKASESAGKDGRFQVFVCIGVRDQWLQRWVRIISKCQVTAQMYEDRSFLRDPALTQFVIQILDSLKDFKIVLEATLVKGVEL